MRFTYQGKLYSIDQDVTVGEVVYSIRGLMPAERAALGLVDVVEQPRPDDRYGFVSEDPATPGAWIFTALDPAELKRRLVARAAVTRYNVETAGTTLGGAPVATDRGSQAMISGAYSYVQANPTATIQFKGADGSFTALGHDQIVAIANGVGAHVQACFAAEASVVGQINAGTVSTFEAVDAAFANIA